MSDENRGGVLAEIAAMRERSRQCLAKMQRHQAVLDEYEAERAKRDEALREEFNVDSHREARDAMRHAIQNADARATRAALDLIPDLILTLLDADPSATSEQLPLLAANGIRLCLADEDDDVVRRLRELAEAARARGIDRVDVTRENDLTVHGAYVLEADGRDGESPMTMSINRRVVDDIAGFVENVERRVRAITSARDDRARAERRALYEALKAEFEPGASVGTAEQKQRDEASADV